MEAESEDRDESLLLAVPASVLAIADALMTQEQPAYLVGGCVRDLLSGNEAGDFDLATALPPDLVLARLPRAIPIGLRHGTVMVPTADGPVDVTTFRAGPSIREDLAHRDFTINAMALDARSGELIDPHGGRQDLADRRLRAVGKAADRFAEDPLRILRAARLATTLELEIDPEIPAAMSELRARLAGVALERIRSELSRLLVAPGVAVGLGLLRRTGVEAELAPGAAPDAIPVVAALPPDLDLRLAGWLRGASAEGILRRLRFSRRATQRVARLLRHHPIGSGINPKRDDAVRKLIKRVGVDDLPLLFSLSEAELAVADEPSSADRARVDAVRAAVERVQSSGALALRRFDLAIDGDDVMRVLGCGPDRSVGRALRFLTDQVVDDPTRNTPEQLRALLESWWSQTPDLSRRGDR